MRYFRVVLGVLLMLLAAACGSAETSAPAGETPAAPTATLEPTVAVPTDTPIPVGPLGTIAGKIIPPSADASAQALQVFAHEVSTGRVFSAEVPAGQSEYVIRDVPEGVYEVVGWFYPDGTAGAYTSAQLSLAETSSDQLKCNTSLNRVTLKEGRMDVTGIDINCWGGDFYYLITPMP
jgi:hypothetical protein